MMLLHSGLPTSEINNQQRCRSQLTEHILTRISSPELTVNSSQRIENEYPLSTTSPGSQSEAGTCSTEVKSNHLQCSDNLRMDNCKTTNPEMKSILGHGDWKEIDNCLETVQKKLKSGWSVHLGKEGRLYYCNQLTQSSSWLPSYEDWIKCDELPYGWERAVDSKGRSYYINHLNKTSTYEAPERIKWENPPEPRTIVLQRNPSLGFGFVAGSERPVIVRFVTEDGPSMNKLLPGDQILTVNGEDVREAPRDHVIHLVRACAAEVNLLVCQPAHNLVPGRKSTLLSAGKRAKLRNRPSRVRFAESVCVNGSPLFPASAFSLGDICVPPMANVLKVFLENGQTKSFKYDATTTVRDVVTSLLDKLCLAAPEMFSLVLEHVKSLKRNKLTLLDPDESVARIAARPGAHKLRCLFRVMFVPISAADLAQRDLNALDYLYMQCCNDVTQERFAPELQPEVALRLAALHMHQHAIANNISPSKLSVKVVEREFGLERFVPASLFDGMKRKELRRLVSHFLKLNAEMTGSSTKVLTQLQAKLYYLDIIASLPSYGAKCFSTNQREGVERVLLVSPRFGLSQIPNVRNSVPQSISAIEDITHIMVNREDDVTCSVTLFTIGDRIAKFFMEDRDACEFSLVLAGYYLLLTGKKLNVKRDREQDDEDNAPSYLAQHTVIPAAWSYLLPYHSRPHSTNFLIPPPFHPMELPIHDRTYEGEIKINSSQSERDRNMNSANVTNSNHSNTNSVLLENHAKMDLDIHSVIATELLEDAKDSKEFDAPIGSTEKKNVFIEAKNEDVMRRLYEMQKMIENSEQYLNEQTENVNEYDIRCQSSEEQFTLETDVWNKERIISMKYDNVSTGGLILPEFDSDCDSINSSKVSSAGGTPQPGILRHSDSLSLLAETINHDLNGIEKSLNSIQGSILANSHLSAISSPRPERKLNGLSILLNNLQIMSNDISLSESDSESVNSPTNSPVQRRPLQFFNGDTLKRKNNSTNRSSFGLHSPEGNNFGQETKDYNLKEYLKQLKEISNVGNVNNQDTDLAAKKLSEIYGFEIREDTFIEIDSDLIDLRSIPPPKTPDELDAFTILNAAPQGFGDNIKRENLPKVEADLDKYLENIVVAPPAQRATPSKELTPEEIMSFIIPPPPNIDENYILNDLNDKSNESLYSNSLPNAAAIDISKNGFANNATNEKHVIEYSTIDRQGKFSCCSKSEKKENKLEAIRNSTIDQFPHNETEYLRLPTRNYILNNSPPARPPKSTELLQRCCHKKELTQKPSNSDFSKAALSEGNPPMIPPRTSQIKKSEQFLSKQTVSLVPRKTSQYVTTSTPLNTTNIVVKPTSLLPISPIKGIPMHKIQQTTKYFHSEPINIIWEKTQILPTRSTHSNINNGYNSTSTEIPTPALENQPQPLESHSSQIVQKSNSTCITTSSIPPSTKPLIFKNGHIINGQELLAKTDVAMEGLLVKLDQVVGLCSAAQTAGGGKCIDEEKFQGAKKELTEQALVLVTATKFLVVSMSDATLSTLPEQLTSCLTAIRRITELTQHMARHTSSPLQTRNIVLKVHDVAANFRELVSVQVGPQGAGQLALQAECLANVLATLLRSLRIFSP